MDFQSPLYLYLLFLLPVMAGVYAMVRFNRRKKLRKFGNASTISHLMPEVSRYNPLMKFICFMIAFAAVAIALARPCWGDTEETTETKKGIEVMIAFDVSRSMLASSTNDTNSVSRLDRAKKLLGDLISKLDNDKVGLIVFAGNAYMQLPMTNDFSLAKMYLEDLSTEMVATQGTDIGAAINMALNCFSENDKVGKAIVLITDTEDNEMRAIDSAKAAAKAGVQVDVIGVGGTNPMTIKFKGDYLKDNEGNVVKTQLNEEFGQELAKAGNGVYISGSAGNAASLLKSHIEELQTADLGTKKYTPAAEQFPWFAAIAIIFLVLDILILERKNGWLKKVNFFYKENKEG